MSEDFQLLPFKDVRAKMFFSIDFLQTYNAERKLITCFRNEKCGVTDFVSILIT